MTADRFPHAHDPRFAAALDLVRRTGATEVQIRYQDDEQPVVWLAVARHKMLAGRPVRDTHPDGELYWSAAAGMAPYAAVMALCETLVDGGTCIHCHRPTGFTEDYQSMPLADHFCWYQYDPELKKFRRSCEGDD